MRDLVCRFFLDLGGKGLGFGVEGLVFGVFGFFEV